MKEIRAVVLGLLVVVVVATILAVWRRPAPEFTRIKGYRVEVREKDGDSTRRVSFSIPSNLVARIAKLAPLRDIGGEIRTEWDGADISARDILEAAGRSKPGAPGVIEKEGVRIEVLAEGNALEITTRDDWDKVVRVRVPRSLVASFAGEETISPRDVLRRLDELGPGEVVTVRDGDKEVTITAEGR